MIPETLYEQSTPACDICRAPTLHEYIDGATTFGPWANMCRACFNKYGIGLGTGRGQRYTRATVADRFTKSEG